MTAQDLSSSISSLVSASSYDFVSDSSRERYTESDESDDDEVVYSVSEPSDAEALSDEDFVVLSRNNDCTRVSATPLGKALEPQNIPLRLQEDNEEANEQAPASSSEFDPETRSHTPSTIDGLASDIEGLSVNVKDKDSDVILPALAPISIPSTDTPLANVQGKSEIVIAATNGKDKKLPSLPERSLLQKQLTISTSNLQADNVSVEPVQKQKKPKKKRTAEEKKARRERKPRRKAKKKTKAERRAVAAGTASKISSDRLTPAASIPKPANQSDETKSQKKKQAKAAAAVASAGLGSRGIVDDLSERFSEHFSSAGSEPTSPADGTTIYEEATGYIDTFLSHPEARENTACKLALLQALIIELGLASSVLPSSLRAATRYLKSRVFMNIREYLNVRKQGLPALQKIMHPNRKALIKDIRKKRNLVPLKTVKESGLQVLLVNCHFH